MQRRLRFDDYYGVSGPDSADFEPVVLTNMQSVIRATKAMYEYTKGDLQKDQDRDSLLDESTEDDICPFQNDTEIGTITEENSHDDDEISPGFDLNTGNKKDSGSARDDILSRNDNATSKVSFNKTNPARILKKNHFATSMSLLQNDNSSQAKLSSSLERTLKGTTTERNSINFKTTILHRPPKPQVQAQPVNNTSLPSILTSPVANKTNVCSQKLFNFSSSRKRNNSGNGAASKTSLTAR